MGAIAFTECHSTQSLTETFNPDLLVQEAALMDGFYEAADWEGIRKALVSKEAMAVTDFASRYALGLRATNALIQMLSQVQFPSSLT